MEQLRGGEEIIVTVDSQPLARVSGIAKNNSRILKNSFAGKIWTAPDFDAPLEEFEDVDA
jgi:antitoxin (DNA-binding transcriptional repressor) of toxin-antitoxin stability system